jgi:hypothetical protein
MGISTGHDNPSSTPTDKISLVDKLAAIKQQKETNQKNVEDESLTPIRNQIKDLQKNAFQIDLVIGAIEEHTQQSNDEKVVHGNGIKNYAKNIEQQFKDESSKIQTLTNENKSLLTEMGIETTEQLIDNPEFTTTEEVIAYKKAKTDAKELVEIDDKNLQEKLKELGVEIDPNNFSYDLTVKALKEKKEKVQDEILLEKIKTPEGKEEVIEQLSKEIENKLNTKIPLSKDQARTANLLPPEELLNSLEGKFGSEIIKSATMKAYERKAQELIEKKTQRND